MPIDPAVLKQQQEDALAAQLAGRPAAIDAGIANTKASVESGRDAFFGNQVNPLAARVGNDYGVDFGGATNSANAFYKNKLGQALGGTLAQQRLGANQDRVSAVWNNAYRKAMESNANEQSARAYAYQVANQTSQENFQASENSKNNALAQREQDIKDAYSRMGLQQSSDAANQNADQAYQQAMMRALFGLAGTGVAAYGISQYGKQPTSNPISSSPVGYGQSLSEQSGFYPRFANPADQPTYLQRLQGGITNGF